jgi:hypothetical protein
MREIPDTSVREVKTVQSHYREACWGVVSAGSLHRFQIESRNATETLSDRCKFWHCVGSPRSVANDVPRYLVGERTTGSRNSYRKGTDNDYNVIDETR